tara:strand:+ start:3440 stop:4075 length:636 start_codon:yes stop_codon:yes gene_type:complete
MEDLPKDVLILLLLDLDIDSVVNMCQTSSKFKNKICLNNYFWLNKLSHDFGISSDLKSAKQKYLDIVHELKVEPNKTYRNGVYSNNLKLVKLGLEYGANPNYRVNSDESTPLIHAMHAQYDEIFDYLVDKVVYDGETFILNAKSFTYRVNDIHLSRKLFLKFIPENIKYFPNNKGFNRVVLAKFIEIFKDSSYKDDKIYNEWIDYYRKLAD